MNALGQAACITAIGAAILASAYGIAEGDSTAPPVQPGSLPPGSPCNYSMECKGGDNYCLGSPSQCRPLSNATAPTHTASPSVQPAANNVGLNVYPRLIELDKRFSVLLEQARAHKISYLKAARQYRETFNAMFPEQASNDLMNEYLAYMAALGERIDKKKLTEAEAEYELARKMSELRDRALAREAPQREEAARRVSEQAARAEQEQRRIAQERDLAERQAAQEKALAQQRELAADAAAQAAAQAEKERRLKESQDMIRTGIQILLGPRPAPVQNCTGRWVGQNWVESCY